MLFFQCCMCFFKYSLCSCFTIYVECWQYPSISCLWNKSSLPRLTCCYCYPEADSSLLFNIWIFWKTNIPSVPEMNCSNSWCFLWCFTRAMAAEVSICVWLWAASGSLGWLSKWSPHFSWGNCIWLKNPCFGPSFVAWGKGHITFACLLQCSLLSESA